MWPAGRRHRHTPRPFLLLWMCLRVDISILVMINDSGIEGYDRRTPELSNAPLHMKQDTTSIA